MSQKNKFYFDMISRSSHKIGALLTVIKEGISLVLEETAGRINQTQKKSLIFSERAVNRLIQLISDFIDLEKILNQEIRFRKEKVNLYQLLNDICESIKHELSMKNVAFKNKLSPIVLSLVYVDYDKTSRAIANIMEDIIRYTPEGGQIHISGTENNDVEISIKSDSIVKSVVGYDNLLNEENIENLLKDNKISFNMVMAKVVIESQGGKINLLSSQNNKNEIIFSIPKYTRRYRVE